MQFITTPMWQKVFMTYKWKEYNSGYRQYNIKDYEKP